MSEQAGVVLVAADGRTVALPQTPDRLSHAVGSGRDTLEFVAEIDERLDQHHTVRTTLQSIEAIADTVTELRWGGRVFSVSRAAFVITETAFDAKLAPIAASVAVTLDVERAPRRRRT